MTDRYAVIGNPVAHSRSPEIQAMFARETGQDISYERILAPRDRFVGTVAAFRQNGGVGANVTLPFKLDAYGYVHTHSERAKQCGAVNTLYWQGDSLIGDNTDGVGLVRDIQVNHGVPIAGRRVLLVGAGGAARGVAAELLFANPAMLTITNRTASRAIEVAEAMSGVGVMQALAIEALPHHQFDLVINATSASLVEELPPIPASCFAQGALAYDMVYGKPLPFLALAQSAGARTADGLGMLVEQAAESFFVWRGVRPSTAPVIAYLRGLLRRP